MTTYKVSGMDCQGCVKSLTRCINGLVPDAQVSVELESGHVSVADTVTEATIIEACKMAGFDYAGKAA